MYYRLQMNSNATLIFSNDVDDKILIDDAFCPEVSYSTNDYGGKVTIMEFKFFCLSNKHIDQMFLLTAQIYILK